MWSRFSLSSLKGCIYIHTISFLTTPLSPFPVTDPDAVLQIIMPRQKTEPIINVTSQRRRSLSDPLAAALRPPENESVDERQRRLRAEEDARRVSDSIDDQIRAEKKEKRLKQEVRVLLLGQSESGKSTTLKREWSIFKMCRSGLALHVQLRMNRYTSWPP